MIPLQTKLHGMYTVAGKVAQGGQGAIYRVVDSNLNVWALKEMSQSALAAMSEEERSDALDSWKREADLLSTLDHPNLCKVVDTFEEQGKQYLVMEFVDGKHLLKLLEEAGGPLDVEQVLDWADQLCQVLSYLHGQKPKIIYRDLKPQNVMQITGGHDLRLIDFGIVRFYKGGKTKDTRKMGTPGYAPPEQYGTGQTDERSDIYALGATLHHLLTNHDPANQPFTFAPIRDHCGGVPRRVDDAILCAVSKRPVDRFGSAEEMRDALLGKRKRYAAAARPLATLPSQAAAGQTAQPTPAPPAPPPVTPPMAVPPPPMSRPSVSLTLSERLLDYGTLARGTIGLRSFRVRGASGIKGKVVATMPWVQVSPAKLSGGDEEVTVQVQTRSLPLGTGRGLATPNLLGRVKLLIDRGRNKGALGILALLLASPLLLALALILAVAQAAAWFVVAHARRFVPGSQTHLAQIEVDTDVGKDGVQVHVTVEPSKARRIAGWLAVGVFVLAEIAAVVAAVLVGVDAI